MAYKRPEELEVTPSDADLTRAMAGIGMNFAAEANVYAPIEETLVFASRLGMDAGDLRVLSVLTEWLGVHASHVNVDRLVRCVGEHSSERVRAYWAAIAAWFVKDRRFSRLEKLHIAETRVDLLPVGTDFQVSRHGEDPRFADSSLRVPAGTLRERSSDVLAPEVLARRHPGYRNRVRMGPTWRADVWTVLEESPGIRAADVARRVGCAFSTAWQVSQDFKVLEQAERVAS